jgi:Flp pilus assembly protein TadD
MGRRRRRKRAQEAEVLQVDLLPEPSMPLPTAAPSAVAEPARAVAELTPIAPPVSTAEPARSAPTAPPADIPRPRPIPGDPPRGPGDPPRAPLAERAARAVVPPGASALGGGSIAVPARAGDAVAAAIGARERHEPAMDHAAAETKPAGEPLVRARSLVEQGRVQEAIQLYLGILTVNPSNLKARNNLGVLYDELKLFDAARDHLEAAVRLEPENVEVLTNLASTLTSLARYDEAEAILRRAQKVDPDDLRVHLAVGILYFRRGLYAQSEVELRWVCARDRESGPAFYYRGEALNRLGRYDEAVQALERAAALLPNDPKPVYTLGHLYDRRHQPEEAAEMYRRARRLQTR